MLHDLHFDDDHYLQVSFILYWFLTDRRRHNITDKGGI